MNQWHLRGVGGDYDYEIIIVENMEFMVMNFLWLSGTTDYT